MLTIDHNLLGKHKEQPNRYYNRVEHYLHEREVLPVSPLQDKRLLTARHVEREARKIAEEIGDGSIIVRSRNLRIYGDEVHFVSVLPDELGWAFQRREEELRAKQAGHAIY